MNRFERRVHADSGHFRSLECGAFQVGLVRQREDYSISKQGTARSSPRALELAFSVKIANEIPVLAFFESCPRRIWNELCTKVGSEKVECLKRFDGGTNMLTHVKKTFEVAAALEYPFNHVCGCCQSSHDNSELELVCRVWQDSRQTPKLRYWNGHLTLLLRQLASHSRSQLVVWPTIAMRTPVV